jgi:hypothetical protein
LNSEAEEDVRGVRARKGKGRWREEKRVGERGKKKGVIGCSRDDNNVWR